MKPSFLAQDRSTSSSPLNNKLIVLLFLISAEGYKSSNRSFLFTLRSFKQEAFKIPLLQNQGDYAMCDYSDLGPSFGQNYDLYLATNCRTNQYSTCSLGKAYEVPYGYSSENALAGSRNFFCDDYEVFYLG